MATLTFTLTMFNTSLQAMCSQNASPLLPTLKLALLDQASAVTEDTSDSGDEFLSDLSGANILSEVTLTTPTFTNRILSCDVSAVNEFPDVGSGNTADKILLYSDTGVASTSRLWGIATLSSPITGDDNPDDLQLPNNGLYRIGPA